MAWKAKPSGGYTYDSEEGKENITEITNILRTTYNYTDEAITGVIVNCLSESGLNPWRWESDIYPPEAYARGCGLFGFTPYSRYLSYDTAGLMNLSTSQVTVGASPTVGKQQVELMANGTWGWVSSGWRPYWNVETYPELYARWLRCIDKYGSNGRITLAQFSEVDDYHDAVLIFLCCFEGPNVPNFNERDANADAIYEIVSNASIKKKKGMPVWMMAKIWC